MAHVLVVGAGLAGARTCTALRAAGYTGRLTLVGAEPDAPYDRPPLTKDPGAEVDLRPAMGIDVWAAADDVRLGVAARGLVAGSRGSRVLVDGGELTADAVVIATGATPVVPADWTGPGVHVLSTRRQAGAFWERVGPGTSLVVVGGGWIGSEAAATAASRGADVRLLEAADQLLPGRLPAAVAARVSGWLAEAGVQVGMGAPVRSLAPDSRVPSVSVDGGSLAADLVLVALGVRPATAWLEGGPLALAPSGAVLVDAWGRTGVPGVLAVGDAAARWSSRSGRHLASGHWTEALNAPQVVAPEVVRWLTTGAWTVGEPSADTGGIPDAVPYVFSEIAGRTLQVLGEAGEGAGEGPDEGALGRRLVWRESSEGWSAFCLDEGDHLRGVVGAGRPRDIVMARRAIAGAAGWPLAEPGALADPQAAASVMFPAGSGARDDGPRDDGPRDNGPRDEGARHDHARDDRARDEGARDDGARMAG